MSMLICVVTHNRLDYTKQCLESIANKSMDHMVVVVDNASDDGTVEWLQESGELYDHLILNAANKYPGAACNRGWQTGLALFQGKDFTHLCRIDNDCILQPGWQEKVLKAFDSFPGMGQFGLIEMSDAKEFPVVIRRNDETGVEVNSGPSNIGGPNVILRELWDQGLRYSEIPWQHHGRPTPQEDVKLSLDIKQMGMWFANTTEVICVEQSFGNTDKYFEYYERTFGQRGHGKPARTLNGEVVELGTSDRDHI